VGIHYCTLHPLTGSMQTHRVNVGCQLGCVTAVTAGQSLNTSRQGPGAAMPRTMSSDEALQRPALYLKHTASTGLLTVQDCSGCTMVWCGACMCTSSLEISSALFAWYCD
jgi:hypothetical protein